MTSGFLSKLIAPLIVRRYLEHLRTSLSPGSPGPFKRDFCECEETRAGSGECGVHRGDPMAPTRSTLTRCQLLSVLLTSFGEKPVEIHVPLAERRTLALHS